MNKNNLIISVGRQLGSGGHDVAKLLAQRFGCTFYDREILNIAAKESGFCEKFFEQTDEQKGFMKSLFHTHVPFVADNSFYNNNFSTPPSSFRASHPLSFIILMAFFTPSFLST